MARRRVNFVDVDVKEDTTVYDIVPDNTKQVVAQDASGAFEVIPIEEAKRRKAIDLVNYNTNQSDIIRGGTVKTRLLNNDLNLFNNFFLKDFDGIQTEIDLCGDDPENDPEYIFLEKFPLPDFCEREGKRLTFSPDYEDIVVVITDYPDNGPFGIHIRKNSPNKENIEKALEGHQYDNPIGHKDKDYADSIKGLEKDWLWICFHYSESQWNFNRNNITAGDCLAKYMENLFAALSGASHPD